MKKLLLTLLTIVLFFSCKKETEAGGYEISGTLKNIPDSSLIYISRNNKNFDSTLVLNGQFKFTGQVANPINIYLSVKNTRDYNSFWLENSKIRFEAEKDNFREATITGSKTQEEDDILSKRLQAIEMEMEALEASYDESMTEIQIDSLRKAYTLLEEKETTTYQDYVKEFPNSLVSSHLLNIYATTWGKEKTEALYNFFSEENKASEYGKEIERYIVLNKNPQVGEQFVDFESEDQNGVLRKMSDVKGKVVLLEFWASWCGPCREENPNLVKTYEVFNPKGFEIFAVSLDNDKGRWLKAIETDGLVWSQVSDLKGNRNEASLIYGVSGIPDNFLIDENGQIIGRNLRGENLNNKLKELLP